MQQRRRCGAARARRDAVHEQVMIRERDKEMRRKK
jgi:hypothetical protein